ncbi:hypothetical protein ACI65C_005512 [Semiaphis heraclei]
MWSDPSSTNMAYGNQWMNMNPAMYQHMTNEQVDWASLAQQWIKMKETPPAMLPGQQVRIQTSEHTLPGQHVEPQNPSNIVAATNTTFNDHNIASPVTRNNIEKPSAWNTWTWQQQQQCNWNWASSATLPIKAPIMESVNPPRPPFITPPLLSEPPPSFPMMTPDKPFLPNNYWAGSNNTVPLPTEPDQWSKLNMIPNMDDRTQDLSFIDAAKRKQLPAWIREGLEKMEREKRRKIEQEQSFNDPDHSSFTKENVSQKTPNSPINFDHETQMVDDDDDIEPVSSDYINDTDTELKITELDKNDPSPPIPRKTKAQIWEDTMLSLREILTKLLMDVTNDMMLNIVKDMLKTSLQIDIQGNQNQTSLAGKLGLGVYGSESESSDESDEEQTISSHKQLKQDSDEAIRERILKRQREFSYIEAKILIELDQLEDREKLVRSKFDNSIKLSEDANDNSSQVVENIQTKGPAEDEESTQNMVEGHDEIKKELSNIKNEQKNKSKSKRSSSSSSSSSSSVSKKSNNSDNKNRKKKSDKIKSKSSNSKTNADSVKKKRRSRSKSRSYSISKSSRSHSRYRSRSRSRHHDRRSPHNCRSRRSRSPPSRHSYSRKYKSKRNSSSSSNESRSKKHRYRR